MRQTGVIKKVIGEKGFGFITADSGQPDHFLHVNDVATEMLPFAERLIGERVAFDSVEGRPGKGPQAKNVTLVQ